MTPPAVSAMQPEEGPGCGEDDLSRSCVEDAVAVEDVAAGSGVKDVWEPRETFSGAAATVAATGRVGEVVRDFLAGFSSTGEPQPAALEERVLGMFFFLFVEFSTN